ncbi:MAG: Rieske (2Fe-2S) protein [Saprospiraceae bacterium]
MTRNEFIRLCGITVAGGLGASLLNGCASAYYFARFEIQERKLSIPVSEFFVAQGKKIKPRKFVLLRIPQFNYPICVFRISETDYTAVLMECTHRSCELQNQGYYLVCPCHGSEFTCRGQVKNPPAEDDLKTFSVKSSEQYIHVEI